MTEPRPGSGLLQRMSWSPRRSRLDHSPKPVRLPLQVTAQRSEPTCRELGGGFPASDVATKTLHRTRPSRMRPATCRCNPALRFLVHFRRNWSTNLILMIGWKDPKEGAGLGVNAQPRIWRKTVQNCCNGVIADKKPLLSRRCAGWLAYCLVTLRPLKIPKTAAKPVRCF